jgi:hypothetical protein
MIWSVLVFVVLLSLPAEASLIPKMVSARKFSSKFEISFRDAKELLTRYAYTSHMDSLTGKLLMEEFGSQIVASRKTELFTDPLLMIAVEYNNAAFVRNWIQSGLPVCERSHDSRNPWHCYSHINPEIREILQKAAIPKNVVEAHYRTTPLWFLLRTYHFDAVRDLIESKTFTEKNLVGGEVEMEKILMTLKNREVKPFPSFSVIESF